MYMMYNNYRWLYLLPDLALAKRDTRVPIPHISVCDKTASYDYALTLIPIPILVLILMLVLILTSVICLCCSVPNPVSFNRKWRLRKIK